LAFYEEIKANNRMTFVLFVAFFLLILLLGVVSSYLLEIAYGVDGYVIVILFAIFAIVYMVVAYYNSDKIVTAISFAKPADPKKFKQLHNIVEEMAIASGLPKPKVYVINDTAINAFATGRNPEHSVVCVTTGCIQRLTRPELTAVVAHEMSHIQNSDIKVMTMAATLVGLAVLLSDFMLRFFFRGMIFGRGRGGRSRGGSSDKGGGGITIVLIIVAIALAILTPIIAQIIKMAISRKREYLADASAVQMTRYPGGLASALSKIKNDSEPLEAANKATAHLYIANPLKGQKLWMKSMFATHPPIDDRIAKLNAM
jgi:heat shock protein HtpX